MCYGVGGRGPISKPFGVIFLGSCSLFFQTKYLQAQSAKKHIKNYIQSVFFYLFFLKMSCGFGMVCGFIEVCFSLRISGETETLKNQLLSGRGPRGYHGDILHLPSNPRMPDSIIGISKGPEAKHIYPQDPWDDLYIYLHLVVFLMVNSYIVILVIFRDFCASWVVPGLAPSYIEL